jgi:glycine/serine hydroxymethyltransferase
MGEAEMREIAEIIVATTRGEMDGLRDKVTALTETYPLYE